MANRSKVVFKKNSNKHASRLVKSFQAINLEDFSLHPDGVWGSTAIIKSGGVTLKSSELDLEFDIPFDDNLESNEGAITVYNLSDNTIKQLKTKQYLSIEAGYEGDTGVLFKGYITKVSTTRESADKVTTIKVIDDIEEKESINLTYASGKTAQYILKDLLNKTGLPIAKFYVERDYTYDNDVTVDEPLETAIRTYSEVCGVSTFTRNGSIYCGRLESMTPDYAFYVSEETGMIGSPSPFEETVTAGDYEDTLEGFEIEMLLQHKAAAGVAVYLKSEQYEGTYYIKSGSHRFNESEAITEIKVIEKSC